MRPQDLHGDDGARQYWSNERKRLRELGYRLYSRQGRSIDGKHIDRAPMSGRFCLFNRMFRMVLVFAVLDVVRFREMRVNE
jgi:hypothetical protein